MQQKLISLIPGHERIVWNIRRLMDGAKILGVGVAGDRAVPARSRRHGCANWPRLPAISGKTAFSSCGCDEFSERLAAIDVPKVLLAGIEAHVCVQQTALDLVANGYRVYVAADAIGSRHRDRLRNRPAAHGDRRRHADHHRVRPVRMVPPIRHAEFKQIAHWFAKRPNGLNRVRQT